MTEAKEEESTCSRLGMCSVCTKAAAKYTCPRCSVKTCSLACVKTHKNNGEGCSGIRNKTMRILKKDMDNLTLLSDYRFLEEIDHKLESNHRHPLRRQIVKKPLRNKQELPFFLENLRKEAGKRGIALKYLPSHFTVHKENSTRYITKEGIIRWHIKWVFHQADVSFSDAQVDENTPILRVLAKYMEPNDFLSTEDSEKLAYYHSASYSRIAVLIKTEKENAGTVFEEVEISKSLRLNLANKVIVEYPVFYVVLRDHIHAYLEYEGDNHDDLFCETKEKDEEKSEGMFFFGSTDDKMDDSD